MTPLKTPPPPTTNYKYYDICRRSVPFLFGRQYQNIIMTKTMKGVWVEKATQTLKDFPIPEPGEGEVLIKVVCAAQNPKDWKGIISYTNNF